MIKGKAAHLDTGVFQVESVHQLGTSHPVAWRVAFLPAFLFGLVLQFVRGNELVFVNLDDSGQELQLLGGSTIQMADGSVMETVAFAADSFIPLTPDTSGTLGIFQMGLVLIQTVVWVASGTDIRLLIIGDRGGRLPDWAWNLKQNGPRISGVQLISAHSFESSGDDDNIHSTP